MTTTTMKSCDEKKKKLTQGKRKIEIKKIEKSSSRYVTFSKRRNGLFKKAAELCIASGAQVGILVQNIGGNSVYSFGHPNVESVIDRYLTRTRMEETPPPPPRFSNDVMQLKQEYDMICKDLQAEEKEKKRIEESKKGNFWWNMDVENLDFEELQEHLTALEELKKKVMARADDLMLHEGWSKSIPFSYSTASNNSSGNCGLDQAVAYGINPPPADAYDDCLFDHHVVAENWSNSIQISDLNAAGLSNGGGDCGLDHAVVVANGNPPADAYSEYCLFDHVAAESRWSKWNQDLDFSDHVPSNSSGDFSLDHGVGGAAYGDCSFIDQVVAAPADDDGNGSSSFEEDNINGIEEDMESVVMLWKWDDVVDLGEVMN